MELFDTHAHLDDEQFDATREAVIERARQAGVTQVVCIGTTAAASQRCVDLAQRYPLLLAAVGIQPNHCLEVQAGDWEQIVALSRQPRVAAIGETGLDRYWQDCPFDLQQDYFQRHLELAHRTGLPFIVHMRNCESDVLQMLREAAQRSPLHGVMHSFTGTLEGALECVALGLHISFSGMVTYKKSDDLRAIAAALPADRIVIETDSPYLSPHPCRSQRPNEPALVRHTAACLAECRGVPVEEFARLTTANARRLFRLA